MTIAHGKEMQQMEDSFLKLVLQGEEPPEAFSRYKIQWEVEPEEKSLAEYMGITETELQDVLAEKHSFHFIAYRYYHRKHSLDRVFPGVYVQFVAEYPDFPAHLEYGWVDRFDQEQQFVEIQCDDNYLGIRSLEIDLADIVRLLPTKERPNVFFKAMLCKECRDCSQESGEFMDDCPFHALFLDLKTNRLQSKETIGRHLGYGKSGSSSCEEKPDTE